MRFRISTSDCLKAEQIVERYPMLNDFGFELVEEPVLHKMRIRNPDGGYLIEEVPKVEKRTYINICTLEDFMELSTEVESGLILFMPSNREWMDGCEYPEIEIYDGYRE